MRRRVLYLLFRACIFIYILTSICIIWKIDSVNVMSMFTDTNVSYRIKLPFSHGAVPTTTVTKPTARYLQARNQSLEANEASRETITSRETNHFQPSIVHVNGARNGLGVNGSSIAIPQSVNETKIAKFYSKTHGFNMYLSDLIGVHRSVGDCRPRLCREKRYPRDLPPASVIIIFRDEYPSIVLRTAYSVLDTTPDHLIKDIVFVDDGSVDEDLKMKIDIHVANVKKFHLIRNEKSLGLMMARQKGIESSLAGYFVVMDSHMEVCEGWLEPIIYRLVQEPKHLLSPQVGGINSRNFRFNLYFADAFDSSFMYMSQISMSQVWVPYNRHYTKLRKSSIEPLTFPVMQGMILAMKKDFFFQLGGFDPGMRVWGTEQMELSVKVWLCGGRVELIPCSRVGHMFRQTQWGGVQKNINHIASNRARFADAWLEGEQREYVLNLQTGKGAMETEGIEDRRDIKRINNCKPYLYFLKQVKPLANIFIPNITLAVGCIYNRMTNSCLDNIVRSKRDSGQLGIYPCHGADNQYFLWTDKYQIRFDIHIIYVKRNGSEVFAKKTVIEDDDPSTIFYYKEDNTIFHKVSGLCVTIRDRYVKLRPCQGSIDQLWEWKRIRKPQKRDVEI